MRVLGRAVVLLPLLCCSACLSTRLVAPSPFRVRNQHPVQLTAMHALARPARVVPAGHAEANVDTDWTSLWLRPGQGRDKIVLDGEIVRTDFDVRVGLGKNMDLEAGIPVLHTGGGVLDPFIESYHNLFGFPQNDRDRYPSNAFDVVARRRQANGRYRDAYRLESRGVYFGDLPILLTWIPLRTDSFGVGLRGGFELPTGDEQAGYGNGGFDENLGYVAEYDAVGYSLFSWGSHTFVHTADTARDAGLSYGDVDTVGIGGQLGLTPELSALVQIEWERSVLRNLSESHADKNQMLIWAGGRYRFSKSVALEAAIGEELILDVSPEVTFHVGLTIDW